VPRPRLIRLKQPLAQRNQRIKIGDRADRPVSELFPLMVAQQWPA
jgi:hypothetical protein